MSGNIEDFLEKLKDKRLECKNAGEHKDIVWHPYTVSSNSGYRDRVNGHCGYCRADQERSLNVLEIEKIDEFRNSLKKPMDL